jgi:hypothetical protein
MPNPPDDDFRPRFRYEMAGLGVVVCAVFAYVAVLYPGWGKIFFAGFCLLTGFILFSTLRRERALLRENLVTRGTVLYFQKGTAKGESSRITYSFEGRDGETYEHKGEIRTPRALKEDGPVLVLYKASDPAKSQASSGFMFYRFRKMLKKL